MIILSEDELNNINGGAVAGAVFGAVFGFGIGLCVSTVTQAVKCNISGGQISAASIFGGAAIYALKGTVAGAVSPI